MDNSLPAINFRLVAFPNEWRKARVGASQSRRGQVSARSERYRIFFQTLIDELRSNHNFTRATKAQAQSWYSFASGVSGVSCGGAFNRGGQAHVDVYIDKGEAEPNKKLFDDLHSVAQQIEAKIGEQLLWERLDNRRASRIALKRSASIDDDQDSLRELLVWMRTHLLKFKEVFGPRLSSIA